MVRGGKKDVVFVEILCVFVEYFFLRIDDSIVFFMVIEIKVRLFNFFFVFCLGVLVLFIGVFCF